MAEELEVFMPNFVNSDENGYLSVNYMELIPVLIAALKEQQAQIEILKQELEKLK